MSEIIVISDDDLEEGEIADDIVPEPVIINNYKPKGKKLPRRYILHENKDLNSKHSKHKHSCRHRRKHHKSCPHHSIDRHKLTEKQISHKKSSSIQSNHRENRSSPTFSDDIVKSAFKNFSSPRRETVASVKLNAANLPVKNLNTPQPIIDIEKTSSELKEKNENISCVNIKNEELPSPNCIHESNDEKLNLLPAKVSSPELIESEICSKSKMDADSEDEDEEELRRIALSTCLKRAVMELNHASDMPVANCNMNGLNDMDQNSCNQVSGATSKSFDKFSSDNYEVVDMELDDDSLSENGNANDLFVIDRNPLLPKSPESLPNHNLDRNSNFNLLSRNVSNQILENEFHLPSSQSQSNDDFEEELLRAEVIASMNSAHKKARKTPEKKLPPVKNKIQTQVQLPPTKIPATHNMKVIKSLSAYSKHPVPNFLNMTSRKVVNKAKLSYSKLISQKKAAIPPQRKINAGPERLVITLNNDTSSEETDEECDKNKDTGENVAVASIEALISDARQKSDIQKSTTNDSNSVSCLSKAQQEEYNALKQMLAQKQTLPKKSTAINNKRTLHNKLIAEKIHDAKDNLSKERKVLKDIIKELFAKKQEYITSKLKVQHLKEQLHAAELVRQANLETWKNSAAKLDIQKKSITKYAAIVDLLEKKLDINSQPQVQNSILSPPQRIDSPGA